MITSTTTPTTEPAIISISVVEDTPEVDGSAVGPAVVVASVVVLVVVDAVVVVSVVDVVVVSVDEVVVSVVVAVVVVSVVVDVVVVSVVVTVVVVDAVVVGGSMQLAVPSTLHPYLSIGCSFPAGQGSNTGKQHTVTFGFGSPG